MEAAGTLAGTGANATVKVTNKALDVLSTALTAADELFYGVDLRNVSIERKACKSAGVTSAALSAWLVLQGPFPDRMNRWFPSSKWPMMGWTSPALVIHNFPSWLHRR